MENEKKILEYLKKVELQNQEILRQLKEIRESEKDNAGKLDELVIAISLAKEISTFGFPDIWKTITIKSCPDKETFKAQIADEKIQVVEEAGKVIDRGEFSLNLDENLEADLVLVSVRELGFKLEGGHIRSIKKKAKTFGLIPFSLEIAPLLRLYCREQPIEKINIMTGKPAKLFEEDSGDNPDLVMFCLMDDSVYEYLEITDGRQDALYGPDEFFLFAKPRK